MIKFKTNQNTSLNTRLANISTFAIASALLITVPAYAEEANEPSPTVAFTVDYKLDVVGVASGGLARKVRHLDNLDIAADINLEQGLGWKGGALHLEASNTSGQAPSEDAGNLQGVDNIEVGARRLRLYQAYFEQTFAGDKANLRLGYSDVSGEFSVADSSGYLINPSFGMAPELAGSGPQGAAAYPSTALTARLTVNPSETSYAMVAAVNARVGVWGDAQGAQTSFSEGELIIAEAGWTGRGKVAVGYWGYTKKVEDLREVNAAGDPIKRRAQGVYTVIEQPLNAPADGDPKATAFLRAGVSDGDTQGLKGSWQVGVSVDSVVKGRPDSNLSFGVTQARQSKSYRANSFDAGLGLSTDETVYELTYSDQVTSKVRVQPDIQYVQRPSGDRSIKDAVVVGLRLNVAF